MESDYKIQKILGKKLDENNEEIFLIKQAGKSYIHCKWWTEEKLFKHFDNAVKFFFENKFLLVFFYFISFFFFFLLFLFDL